MAENDGAPDPSKEGMEMKNLKSTVGSVQEKAMSANDGAPDLSEESTDGNIEKNEEENKPSTSHKVLIGNKTKTDENSKENEVKNEQSSPRKKTTLSSEEMEEMEKILQKLKRKYAFVMANYQGNHLKEHLLESSEYFEKNVRKLLLKGFVPDNHENTLLHYAVVGNSVDSVTTILTKWPQTVNTKGADEIVPLHIAALLDFSDIATKLIDANAYLNAQDRCKATPVITAAMYGSWKVVKMLLRKNAGINQTDLWKNSVLHLAMKSKNTDVLKILLYCKDEAYNAEIKKILKNRNDSGYTALHCAVYSEFLEGIKILLNCEDETRYAETKNILQTQNRSGDTALHSAVKKNFLEGIKIMIDNLRCYSDYESLLKIQDAEKKTVFHIAAEKGFLECIKLLCKKDEELTTNEQTSDWSQLCIPRERLLNIRCSEGRTALHYAVMNDREETVEFLREKDADCNMQDRGERTPLSYAAEQGLVQIARLLLSICEIEYLRDRMHVGLYSDVSIKDIKGMAPIHYAAKKDHSEVVKIFLKWERADIRSVDGRNILDIAIEEKNVKTVMEIIKSDQWKQLLCNKTEPEKETGGPQSPTRKLIVHMPDIAREVFNRCTETKGTADEFEAEFNYEFLDDTFLLENWIEYSYEGEAKPYTEDANVIKRNHPLMIMVTKKRTELLDHPLVSALIKRKWTSIGLIFYLLNVLMYIFYLTMLTGFALDIQAPYQFINTSVDVNVCLGQPKISEFAEIAQHCVIVSAALELVVEILELIVVFSGSVWSYVSEPENVLEWIACICSISFVVNTSGCTDTAYRNGSGLAA